MKKLIIILSLQAPFLFAAVTSQWTMAQIDAGVALSYTALQGATKATVGLSNVDNTADTNKPISNAQAATNTVLQAQIDSKVSTNTVSLTGIIYDDGTNLFFVVGGVTNQITSN